jgi:2-oxoisovalerate dehydrogenase E2 component (dihydrolipoyl transacylase)
MPLPHATMAIFVDCKVIGATYNRSTDANGWFGRLSTRQKNLIPFLLADIGEGIAEVEVLQWFVQPSNDVKQFDKVCEVQSDKATVEISRSLQWIY